MIKNRFRGFLPVVIDVETAGFNAKTDALLEIAIVILTMDDNKLLHPKSEKFHHIIPFDGSNLEKEALEFTGIDPYHPFRYAIPEKEAMEDIFDIVNEELKLHKCKKAVLVGHNAWFDLSFINAAAERCNFKSPFHSFTSFDTATLSGLVYGQTVLAKALKVAKINYNQKEAHFSLYDAQKTAELFCAIVNKWKILDNK